MQRRTQYGSSGELEVFAATRYFDGLTDLATGPEDLIQVKAMHRQEEEGHRSTRELGASTNSNLAAFVSPAVSFRKNPPVSSSTTSGINVEPSQVSVSSCAAACSRDLGEVVGDRRLQGVRIVRMASGDVERWVVRCGGHALEEQHHHVVHEKIAVGTKSSDDHRQVEKAEDGHAKIIVDTKLSDGHQMEDDDDWGSDTSSDLFELDLQD